MRRDEQFAKEAFDRMLGECSREPRRWRSGRNPPDYYLRVGRTSFAVEVTQIMESIDLGTHSVTERGALKALQALEQEIETRALDLGILRGAYSLHLCPIANLRVLREDLIARAMQYIRDTRADRTAPKFQLAKGRPGQQISIQKFGHHRSIVGATFSIGGAKWQGEVDEELAQLLKENLLKKWHKLRRTRLPRILLMVDAYHYAESKDWHNCATLQHFQGFHTVARVHSDFRCQVLMSRRDRWRPTMRSPS